MLSTSQMTQLCQASHLIENEQTVEASGKETGNVAGSRHSLLGKLSIEIEREEKEQLVECKWERDRSLLVAGSRHTLRQIIMPGRFSTVMKPKVNCFTICFTKLSTLKVVPEQFCEVTGSSHSKSC